MFLYFVVLHIQIIYLNLKANDIFTHLSEIIVCQRGAQQKISCALAWHTCEAINSELGFFGEFNKYCFISLPFTY